MESMLGTLESGAKLHAVAVHTPVALSALGVPLVVLTAFVQREKHTLRTITLAAYVLLLITSFGAVRTGDLARAEVPSQASAEVWDLLERHEDMADAVWIFGAVTAAFIVLSFVPAAAFRNAMIGLAFVASTATAGWVAVTGHYGGDLVYAYGVGTQPFNASFESPPASVEETESEAGKGAGGADDAAAEAAPVDLPGELEGDFMPIRPIDMTEAATISYTQDIVPIIETYCIHCHEGRRPDGNYDMTTYANLFEPGDKHGPGIIAGKPDESPAVQYIRGILRPQMPKGEEPVPEDDLHTLRLWIAAGAENDAP